MQTYFHYDSRDHRQPLTRLGRFLLFLLTLSCLLFAVYLAYHYFTDWSADEQGDASRAWLLAAIGLFLGGLAILAFITTEWFKTGYRDYQSLTFSSEGITWRFDERTSGEVPLKDIQSHSEDPRHLILHCRDGELIWIENYLLKQAEQWDAFVQVAKERLPVTAK